MASGIDIDIKSNLGIVTPAVRAQVAEIVEVAAHNILNGAKIAIEETEATGRIYHVGGETDVTFNAGKGIPFKRSEMEKTVTFRKGAGPGRVHQASAPGEPPANDTGNLANSGAVRDPVEAPPSASVVAKEVAFTSPYAAPLEEGTEDGHIAPRPFLRPAVEAQAEGYQRAVALAVSRGAQDAAL